MKIKIYGSRGTMPFFNRNSLRYGGNTSCVRVDIAGRVIVLDCGSGLSQFYYDYYSPSSPGADKAPPVSTGLDILLSHLHIDHLIGLSGFPPLFFDSNIRIHTKLRNGPDLASQIFGIFNPPYWPVSLGDMSRAQLVEIKEDQPFMLGKVRVLPRAAKHPDGTTCFRIDAEKSLVYLLDYEIDCAASLEALAEFCADADAVIFDATYLPMDYQQKRGWGHSTFEAGVQLAKMSNCRNMIFSHISQDYGDERLDLLASSLMESNPCYRIAHDGMELLL